jgi:hypothetical protein
MIPVAAGEKEMFFIKKRRRGRIDWTEEYIRKLKEDWQVVKKLGTASSETPAASEGEVIPEKRELERQADKAAEEKPPSEGGGIAREEVEQASKTKEERLNDIDKKLKALEIEKKATMKIMQELYKEGSDAKEASLKKERCHLKLKEISDHIKKLSEEREKNK